MLQAKGASLGVQVRTWKTNRRCASIFCMSCPSTAARMHTYGLLPPAGALICCWDPWYGRAWAESAWNLRAGWVVSTVQDEREMGAPRPKRARSCSPPARLYGEQSAAMIRVAQDKPYALPSAICSALRPQGTRGSRGSTPREPYPSLH